MVGQLQCHVSALNDGHLVEVTGDIDIATASSLADALAQFASGNVTVDLTDVTFIDSSGLHVLAVAHRDIERRRSRLHLQGVTPIVRKLFVVAGLDALLCVDPIDDELPEPGAN